MAGRELKGNYLNFERMRSKLRCNTYLGVEDGN